MGRMHESSFDPRRFASCLQLSQNNYIPMGCIVDCGTVTGIDLTGNRIYATPFFLPVPMRIKQYGMYVDSVSTPGRKIAFGIYADNWDWARDFHYPYHKIDESPEFTVNAAGFFSKTCTPPLYLPGKQLYFMVYSCDLTGIIYPVCANTTFNVNQYISDATYPLVMYKGWSCARTHAVPLPEPFPTSPTVERFGPVCYAREVNQNGT